MAAPVNHPLSDSYLSCYSNSVGASPVPAYVVAPYRCRVLTVGAVLHAAISSADATVTTAIGGTAITNGAITIPNAGSGAGTKATATPTRANIAKEGDVISFTSASASGSAVGCDFFAVVRMV